MANRVEHFEVLEIIDTSLGDTIPFITAANLIVTEKLGDSSLSAAHLKEIERWLAAHLIAIRDPKASMEKVGEAQVQYISPKTGLGLEGTSYGQQVLLLDTTGTLNSIGKQAVSFGAFGVYDDENVSTT